MIESPRARTRAAAASARAPKTRAAGGPDAVRIVLESSLAAFAILFTAAAALAAPAGDPPSVEELRYLSLEELASVPVVSVFRRPEPLRSTPASVYVITREEIRRSGARTLVEALRLAPNLEVARRSSREYAVSARGFNYYQLSNKMLVQIDGRSVYTPLHAGVFWDQQQVMVDDIDRIEVFSGPGGTIWGANATNGVINVVTRDAQDTAGGLVSAAAGTRDHDAAVRWGGRLAGGGAWRAYGLAASFGETVTPSGDGRDDDWRALQAGFRADWGEAPNRLKIQGDLFRNREDGRADATLSGGNLLARWRRDAGDGETMLVRTYLDVARRDAPLVRDRLETFDVDGYHTFRHGERHQIVWGGGFRFNQNEFDNDFNLFKVRPQKENVSIASLFVEDSIAVRDDLSLSLGVKLEHSSYTGADVQPSLRLGWEASETTLLWAAVSRAVRTPSRIDRDLEGAGILERADESFDAERLVAWELGYRGRPDERTSFSVSLYHHDYDELRALEVSPTTGLLRFGNVQHGYTRGVEAWAERRVSHRWRLAAGLNLFDKHLTLEPGGLPVALDQHQGDDPDYQASLRSSLDFGDGFELDLSLRHVARLPAPVVPDYTALDVRLGWHLSDRLELSLVGQNLLESHRPETGRPEERGEIERSAHLAARVRF